MMNQFTRDEDDLRGWELLYWSVGSAHVVNVAYVQEIQCWQLQGTCHIYAALVPQDSLRQVITISC